MVPFWEYEGSLWSLVGIILFPLIKSASKGNSALGLFSKEPCPIPPLKVDSIPMFPFQLVRESLGNTIYFYGCPGDPYDFQKGTLHVLGIPSIPKKGPWNP